MPVSTDHSRRPPRHYFSRHKTLMENTMPNICETGGTVRRRTYHTGALTNIRYPTCCMLPYTCPSRSGCCPILQGVPQRSRVRPYSILRSVRIWIALTKLISKDPKHLLPCASVDLTDSVIHEYPVRWLCNSRYPRISNAKSCMVKLKSIRNRIPIALEVERVIDLCRKGIWIGQQR